MMCIVDIIKFHILSVNRKCVLCQIVRSDTEEVNFLCQQITDHDRCRRLYHNPLLHFSVTNSFCIQFSLNLFHNRLDLPHFIDRDNHRIHNCNIAICACAKKGSQLSLEYLRSIQADSDRTIAHSRILFFFHMEVIHLFIRTDIKRPDNHFFARHILCNRLICLELCFFIRIIVSFQIQKLTSEQTDTSRIIGQYSRNILHASNVRIQTNLLSIQGYIFFAPKLL